MMRRDEYLKKISDFKLEKEIDIITSIISSLNIE
jgi:hypothetical protein